MVPLTLWRLAETIVGLHPGERHNPNPKDLRWGNRLKALGLAVVYAAVAVTAVQFALGSRKSGAAQNAGLSARMMRSTEGKAVLRNRARHRRNWVLPRLQGRFTQILQ
jgi:hypothetical protein